LLVDFCKERADSDFATEKVLRQAVYALGKKKTPEVLELLLQMARTFTVQQRKLVVAVIAPLLKEMGERYWREGILKGNAVYRNCLLKGLRKGNVLISTDAFPVLQRVAQREIEAIEWEKKSLQVLSGSDSNSMVLLFYAIREELIAIRMDTLFQLISLLDTTGIVASVIPRINHNNAHVRARALEVLENTGDKKINRSIINTIEWLDTLHPDPKGDRVPTEKRETMVATTYSVSHNEWVATCAEYACSQSESEKR
jgi:hypothetical protein